MKGVNSLDPVIQTAMDERSEVFLDHCVHPVNQNGVLGFKELMTWVGPLFNGLFDEPPGDDKWIVVRELSCLGPTLDLSDRTTGRRRSHSLLCHTHNLIHIDGALVGT